MQKQLPGGKCKKVFFQNFAKITGKYQCYSFSLIKKRFWHKCFFMASFYDKKRFRL